MSVTVTIRDETASGQVYSETPLQFPTHRISARELIRERVYQEVQDFNRQQNQEVFRGLVQPTETERVLNGQRPEFRMKQHREIDWKEQFDKAIDSFQANGFFILVGDRQVDSLDEKFEIDTQTQVSFVRLTMLVGG
jgi:hypothetical protein